MKRLAALYQQFLSRADDSSADPSTLVHARTRLATAYFLLHRYRESLEAVAPLTSNKSRHAGVPAQAWLVDGLDRLELGQLPDAIASFERTLALNPTSGTARLALGDTLERSGRLEEAAREYEEQTRATPVPDAWYKLGLAYARLAARVSEDFTDCGFQSPGLRTMVLQIISLLQTLRNPRLAHKNGTMGTHGTRGTNYFSHEINELQRRSRRRNVPCGTAPVRALS